MLVQSPTASEAELREEFEAFLQQYAEQIGQMTTQQLSRHKQALLTNLQEAPKNLGEMNSRFSESLRLGYADFQFRLKLIQQINSLTLDDIKTAYHRLVVDKPRQLWVQTLSADGEGESINQDPALDGKVYRYAF
jgi:secreted Zn-dependent insulinase-like peptidase